MSTIRPEKMEERAVYAAICSRQGIRARDIADVLHIDRKRVNQWLYSSPFLKELCWQDDDYRWHGLISQNRPHQGLSDFAGYYSTVSDFRKLDEDAWLARMKSGCDAIGRSLTDTRGLIHSFLDSRQTMLQLFDDLEDLSDRNTDDWEIVFELRIKKSQHIRIYADVLVVTESEVYSLEFKMKDTIDPAEVTQAAKYAEPLEVIFGPKYNVIPVLVLTAANDLFTDAPLPGTDGIVPVCSGDMLFNVFLPG